MLGLAAPITGAALGWIILHEQFAPVQIAGFLIAISAVAYGATLGTIQPNPSSGIGCSHSDTIAP